MSVNICCTLQVFDIEGSGALNASEFRSALVLMGENVPDDAVTAREQFFLHQHANNVWQIDALFQQADSDGSGKLGKQRLSSVQSY